jgi:putative pyruvate formate lyase activating enzyme
MSIRPAYLHLLETGELENRVGKARAVLADCVACPNLCNVNRFNREYGTCYSGSDPILSSYTLHFGEEPVLSGTRGAGNIFFGNCNLTCVYCQNFEISQRRKRELRNEITIEKLADIMLELQRRGAHNIGLVSPTHFSPVILEAIFLAGKQGLTLPIIYNSNGYDSVEMLKLYEGVIDIYLPDIKYGCNVSGERYSGAAGYFNAAKAAVKEMYRQVGAALIYEGDVVVRGLIIRHLVLPNDLADSELVLQFIARELDPEIYISLMSQYYPANNAHRDILLNRTLRPAEYARVLMVMDEQELHNGWRQELESEAHYRPRFEDSRDAPFQSG